MINNGRLTIEEKMILEQVRTIIGDAIMEAIKEKEEEKENTPELLKALIEEQKAKGKDIEIREISMAELLNIINEEVDNHLSEDSDDCDGNCDDCENVCDDEDSLTPDSFFEFLKTLSNRSNEEDDKKCDCSDCDEDCNSLKDLFKNTSRRTGLSIEMEETSDRTFDFAEMIEEYEDGYKGFFTDGEEVYDYINGTLLIVHEAGRYPADITTDLLNGIFIKEKVVINNEDALELAISGEKVKFELDINNTLVTGTLSSKDGVPSYSVDNTTHINNSDIILLALFKGLWNL